MKRLKIALLFISIFLVRYFFDGRALPTEGEVVKVSFIIIDFPVYSDSQTIVKKGKWEVRIEGYTQIMPGDEMTGEGVVEHERLRVKSQDLAIKRASRLSLGDSIMIGVSYVRRWAVARLQRSLPEPMASLASGILLGVKAQIPYDFYQQLVNTGTLHIIAASGFNVMIVATLLMTILGKFASRKWSILLGILGIVGYVILSGASASVVRAGIMGSLTLISFYFGRPSEAQRLLWVTAILMLICDPSMVSDIGFQLSVSATAGLLYLSPYLINRKQPDSMVAGNLADSSKFGIAELLNNYFVPTLVATIATAPVIWWHFGRLSLIGILVNMLILPTISIIMFLAVITLIFSPARYVLYVPLWWVVRTIQIFGNL